MYSLKSAMCIMGKLLLRNQNRLFRIVALTRRSLQSRNASVIA